MQAETEAPAQAESSVEASVEPQTQSVSRARRLVHAMGLDRAIAITVFGRGWTMLSGPVTLIFLARFLSPNEQGYYYTFSNILNLQVFFELGLTGVILQFAAHEKAKLKWTPAGALEGDEVSKSRMASLLRLALGYYAAVAALVALVVLPAGLWFFAANVQSGTPVLWRLPWLVLVLVTASALFISPIFALLEGCGLVAQTATVRLYQNVTTSVLLWVGLTGNLKLLALPLGGAVALAGQMFWLWRVKKPFLVDLLAVRDLRERVDWRREIWPFQWRIALSWMTGYFTGNLFNPILFAFHGAAAAGRMGMSFSLTTALWATAFAWISTKSAPFGFLVVQKDYAALDKLFFPCLRQAVMMAVAGAIALLGCVFLLRYTGHSWSHRLLAPLPFSLLLGATILSLIIASQAIYLRAHKQEPFLTISVISGTLMAISAYVMGRWYGETAMMAGYFLIHVLILKLSTDIFIAKRRLWHAVPLEQSAILRERLARVRSNSIALWDDPK